MARKNAPKRPPQGKRDSTDRELAIPIIVEEPAGVARQDDLLLGGVPVARGILRTGGFFTLTGPDGQSRRIEGTPAAYWPDGSIKWLHVCGLVNLAAGARNAFRLSLAPEAAPEGLNVEKVRTVNEGALGLQISGGPLDVKITAHRQDILSVRYQGQRQLLSPGLSARLVLAGPDGGNRRALDWQLTEAEPRVVVQTANRVVVRLAGRFVKPSGGDAGELILFIEIFRETAELRLEPVFIYLGQPEEDLIEALTLTVHTPMSGEDVRYGFANDRGRGFWDVIQRVKNDERGGDGPRWPQARQVQLGSSFYVTEKRTGPDASWTKCVEGQRAIGWCHLAGAGQNVTAAMRYYWQEYPRSLTLDADAGTVVFGLVPSEARPLDLRRYSTQVYGSPTYEYGKGPFPRSFGATGIAKANELMLRFDTTGPENAPERGLFFARPVRPVLTPEGFAASEVVGRLAPPRPDRFPVEEETMARTTDFLVRERDGRGWYGLMNFGDIMCAYYADLDRWAFDDGGYAWINTESRPDYGLWIQALRSARADWLAAAIEMTRHNRDVDTYHRGMHKGSGTRHNVNHWGCQDKEWRVSMPISQRLHYYVTADPWSVEVIRDTVGVYRSYERTAGVAPSMTAAFSGILTLWELDNRPEDERALAAFADVIADAVRPDNLFTASLHVDLATGKGHPVGDKPFEGHFFMNLFGGQHTLVEYVGLTGHEKLAEALVRHVQYYVADPKDLPAADHRFRAAFHVMLFLAHALRKTGDKRVLQALREALPQDGKAWCRYADLETAGGPDPLDESPHLRLRSNIVRRNKISCSLGEILHQVPFGLAAIEDAPSGGRRQG